MPPTNLGDDVAFFDGKHLFYISSAPISPKVSGGTTINTCYDHQHLAHYTWTVSYVLFENFVAAGPHFAQQTRFQHTPPSCVVAVQREAELQAALDSAAQMATISAVAAVISAIAAFVFL